MMQIQQKLEKGKLINLNFHNLIWFGSCRDQMSEFSSVRLEYAGAEIAEVSGGEFVAGHLSLVAPLLSIDGENSIAEESFEDVVVERTLEI